jgi:polysaccharide biosynthesis protein PslL
VDILPQNVESAIAIILEPLGTLNILLNQGAIMKVRIEWIDVLRGLGILLVVIGHCFTGVVHSIIYTFHMPLFFVLGGLLYRPSSDYRGFFQHKAIHLLIPYIAFFCLIYSNALIYLLSHPSLAAVKGLILTLGKGLYGGKMMTNGASAFWFVTCFLGTQQVFNYLYTKLSTKKLWAVLGLAFLLSYVDAYCFKNFVFPGNLNVALAALPYFGFGVFLQHRQLKPWAYGVAAAIGAVSIYLMRLDANLLNYDMKYSDYGIPIFSQAVAIAGVVLSIGLAKQLNKSAKIKQSLVHVGLASMIILYIDPFIQIHVKLRLGADAYLWRLAASLLGSLAMYQIFVQFPLTRALFLGSSKDFQTVFARKPETLPS